MIALIVGTIAIQAQIASADEEHVSALVYDFPPYYQLEEDGSYSGLGIELLRTMSELSPDFEFQIINASPRRRHMIFKDKKVDISLFDQASWGWSDMNVDHTSIYMRGGEKYITKKQNGESQETLFDNLKDKRIAAILGYHYLFANFNADPLFLEENFEITLVSKQDQIIKMVRSRRVEIGIVTEAFLQRYLARRPFLKDKLIISDFYDQEYEFVGIRRKDAKISLSTLDRLIAAAMKAEDFQLILEVNDIMTINGN
ncbi:substrate-binding periplasmic protein [Curvivirga sp.]|uniref:substrate-binding periplasmic protein n=1 Tax=Curvivirga sp. TaxID=2856848 RepID=UPI003B5BCF21